MVKNDYDVIIIGAGILGCFCARALSKYDLKVAVIEKREDVCTGISKANLGVVYAGYDMKPDSLKAKLTVSGNADFEKLCNELGVSYLKTGSLMVAYGPKAILSLEDKYKQGIENHVPGLKLISGDEASKLEPNLKKGIVKALYSETTGAVNPWELGIAAYENAKNNGVNFFFNEEVSEIEIFADKTSLLTSGVNSKEYTAKVIINCAGAFADSVRELACKPSVRINKTSANYLVYDAGTAGLVNHIIFYEPEEKKKSFTIVPTLYGNLMIGGTENNDTSIVDYATTGEDINSIFDFAREFLPCLDQSLVINEFGSVRPNPYLLDDENRKLNDFNIVEDERLISFIGIKTPGVTCSAELGKLACEKALDVIGNVQLRDDYDPIRKPLPLGDISNGEVVCRCSFVTDTLVKMAIERGACTVNGVRRRTGAGMGRCQGTYCEYRIIKILADELGIDPSEVTMDGKGSEILIGNYS